MRPKLLFIDDDPASLLALAEAVRGRLDVTIDLAKSARAALKLIGQEHYDVIVCDVVMPHMDGFELLKTARELWPDSVIIMVTGRDLTSEERALTHGAYAFMAKPLGIEPFVELLAKAIQDARLLDRVKGRNALSALEARLRGFVS